MFGKFSRPSDGTPRPVPGRVKPRSSARSKAQEPLGSQRVSPEGRPRTIATYDQLGQTVVATVTLEALSGSDSVELTGELGSRLFLARSAEGEGAGARHVVFDLQNVQYMDSMCIGTLVEFMARLRESGGRIALVNAAHNVEYLFKLTRLDRVFPICRDVMKAIERVERDG